MDNKPNGRDKNISGAKKGTVTADKSTHFCDSNQFADRFLGQLIC